MRIAFLDRKRRDQVLHGACGALDAVAVDGERLVAFRVSRALQEHLLEFAQVVAQIVAVEEILRRRGLERVLFIDRGAGQIVGELSAVEASQTFVFLVQQLLELFVLLVERKEAFRISAVFAALGFDLGLYGRLDDRDLGNNGDLGFGFVFRDLFRRLVHRRDDVLLQDLFPGFRLRRGFGRRRGFGLRCGNRLGLRRGSGLRFCRGSGFGLRGRRGGLLRGNRLRIGRIDRRVDRLGHRCDRRRLDVYRLGRLGDEHLGTGRRLGRNGPGRLRLRILLLAVLRAVSLRKGRRHVRRRDRRHLHGLLRRLDVIRRPGRRLLHLRHLPGSLRERARRLLGSGLRRRRGRLRGGLGLYDRLGRNLRRRLRRSLRHLPRTLRERACRLLRSGLRRGRGRLREFPADRFPGIGHGRFRLLRLLRLRLRGGSRAEESFARILLHDRNGGIRAGLHARPAHFYIFRLFRLGEVVRVPRHRLFFFASDIFRHFAAAHGAIFTS